MLIAIGAAAIGTMAAGAWHLFLWLAAEYRLGRHEVEVMVYDRVIRRVPLSNIDDVLVGVRFPAEFWPGRYATRGHWISIRKKHGLFRYLVICPRNPAGFRRDVYFALGWDPDAG